MQTQKIPGVKHVIAVASGKGGVGKSTVTANLAVALAKQGYKVGLLDADIYGPSIPKMMGVEGEQPGVTGTQGEERIIPIEQHGVKILSIGFFLPAKDPAIWRGPMASNALKQLMNQGQWGELDFLLIDLPPGTGDIHITLINELHVNGAIIVSTPQQVALASVIKGLNMFRNKDIHIPILGLVENMAWFTPEQHPDEKYFIFGKENCEKFAKEEGLELLGRIPVVQGISESGDAGEPVSMDSDSITGKAFHALAEKVVTFSSTKRFYYVKDN